MGDGFVGVPYQKTVGSDTSRDAAVSMVPHVANQRERAWDFVDANKDHGATAQEANAALGIKHNCCSRFTELRQLGRIKRNGSARKTTTGRYAEVHVAIHPDDWEDKRTGWPCPRAVNTTSRGRLVRENQRLWRALETFDDSHRKLQACPWCYWHGVHAGPEYDLWRDGVRGGARCIVEDINERRSP